MAGKPIDTSDIVLQTLRDQRLGGIVEAKNRSQTC
jgi:hypothetical protein